MSEHGSYKTWKTARPMMERGLNNGKRMGGCGGLLAWRREADVLCDEAIQ